MGKVLMSGIVPQLSVPSSFTVSLTAKSGVTYTNGIADLDTETISAISNAISNNSAITNETSAIYVDHSTFARKISIGDQVTIALDGNNYAFDIIGFNHDDLTDANAYGSATVSGKAGMTLQMHNCFARTYKMNATHTNSGGWKSSEMRTSSMVTIEGYMPSAWQSVVKPVNKTTGNGNGSSGVAETVSDKYFLLSTIEVFNELYNTVPGEGYQYAYYKAGNTKQKNNTSGSGYPWWMRSPLTANTTSFRSLTNTGGINQNQAANNTGVAFAFCV